MCIKENDMNISTMSKQTQRNWWTNLALASSAILAALSGIYFLFLPSGGFQGGRNPSYGVQILFSRQTWDDLHTWSGVAMIAAALIHLIIHWHWVEGMFRRVVKEMTGNCSRMNARARWNLVLNLVVGLSFLITAISGVYFLFFPGGHKTADPLFLFSRSIWDLLHTWAGVILIAAAIIHLAIHWKWVTKVTGKMLAVFSKPGSVSTAAPIRNTN
jgi:hypothetical protein